MTQFRALRTILLFGPGTAILPSQPPFYAPSRVAEVKAGQRPPRIPRGLALTAASTAAPDCMKVLGRARTMGNLSSWVS
jgi:hypothetical protein